MILFDALSGEEVSTFRPRPRYPSGQRLFFTGANQAQYSIVSSGLGTLVIWDAPKQIKAVTLGEPESPGVAQHERLRIPVGSGAFVVSNDGQFLATAGAQGNIDILEIDYSSLKTTLSHAGVPIEFSPYGEYIATVRRGDTFVDGYEPNRGDTTVRVFNTAIGKEVAWCPGENATFSPDQSQIAVWGKGEIVRLFDLGSVEPLRVTAPALRDALAVALTPDGRFAAAADQYDMVYAFETATGKNLAYLPRNFAPRQDHEVRPGDLFVEELLFTTRALTTWSINKMSRPKVLAVALSPDGRYLARGGDDRRVRVFDSRVQGEIADLPHNEAVWDAAFSADGHFMATCSVDGVAMVFETVHWKTVAKITPHKSTAATAIAMSPYGHYVAVGYRDNTTRIIEVASHKEVSRSNQGGAVLALAFGPDGEFLATANLDHTVRVLKVSSARNQEVLRLSHDQAIRSLAFNPDGERLATVTLDGTARIFDVRTGVEISRIDVRLPTLKIAFASGGSQLVAAAGWHRLVLGNYLLRPKEMIYDLCSRLPRNLTDREWVQYIGVEAPYRKTCPSLP
ncbi:MAG TPA: hypothetical protein VGK29_13260 [Paludibaculum sp.]